MPLYQFYGQSEMGFLTESGPATPKGSVGTAVAGVRLRIKNMDGQVLSLDTPGRIRVRTDIGFGRYLSGEALQVDEDG